MIRKYNVKKLAPYFSGRIAEAIEKLSPGDAELICEIRLRADRPVSVQIGGKERFLTLNGGLTDCAGLAVTAKMEDIEHSFNAVCDYSVHSYKREISQGFITIRGGNRVGICATAVTENGNITTLKYISGLNFRISGQAFGCADEICSRYFSQSPCSMIIIGPPASGKTTLLKDMCRSLGSRYRISVIDERGEIGAVYHGVPQNSIGAMTDVFDGYPKAEGITAAVRVMSPQIVMCDELGGSEDCDAVSRSVNSGVKIIASAHGFSPEDAFRQNGLESLVRKGIFEYAAVLKGEENPGKIEYIKKAADLI